MPPKFKHGPRKEEPLQPMVARVPEKLNRATALLRQGRLAQAQLLYEKVLKAQPGNFDALTAMGIISARLGNLQRALMWFDKAAVADPDNVVAYVNTGLALHSLAQLDAALASYDQAIAKRFDHAAAHFGRGNVLLELRQLDAALESYRQALALNESYVEAYCNQGVVLHQLEQFDAALACFDRAIALRPDFVEGHLNRSFVHLANGNFAEGWVEYEWRHRLDRHQVADEHGWPPQRGWLATTALAGKTILLQSEQGFGDTLQFCRYTTLLAEAGARVILEAQKPLMSLLANLEGVSQLVATGSSSPVSDYRCRLMSLPLAFDTNLATIPRPGKYLSSDPRKLGFWQSKLGPRLRPRIGLVWSGSATNRNERNRSFALAELVRSLPAGFEYFRLQKDIREADAKTLRSSPQILDFSSDFADFSDTAALCDCMDLVISSCTSVAHLSAALGRKTWILLGHAPNWRWLVDRDDSPWYAAAKLYRRRLDDTWHHVFERIAADLLREFA